MTKRTEKLAHLRGEGVYYILNTHNNRIYVGQSGSIPTRCRDHLNGLLAGKHPNYWLQQDWNEYGADAFEFGVLTECHRLSQKREVERIFIRAYQSEDRRYGYNLPLNARYRSATYRNQGYLITKLTWLELAA